MYYQIKLDYTDGNTYWYDGGWRQNIGQHMASKYETKQEAEQAVRANTHYRMATIVEVLEEKDTVTVYTPPKRKMRCTTS